MTHYLCFLIFLIVFIACKEESADLSFETIVDSSFNCEVIINNEKFSFAIHDQPSFTYEEAIDSILIVANLNYWVEPNNHLAERITIGISKKFKLSELRDAFFSNGQFHFSGALSHKEFSSIFHTGKYSYSFTNCTYRCTKSSGASIEIQYYHGSLYRTDFLNNFIDNSQKYAFYHNAEFNLSKVTPLGEGVVLEGTLKADIYSFIGELVPIQAKFKGYSYNIH